MKPKVLIITFAEDHYSVLHVEDKIRAFGGEVVRWNTDEYLTKNLLSSSFVNGKWSILLNDGVKIHSLDDITAVWSRKLTRFALDLADELDPKYFDACTIEAKEATLGLMTRLSHQGVFMLNDFNQMKYADIKEEGLRLAVECGLKIPNTCITNDPQVGYDFIQNCKNGAISKTLRGVVIKENTERSFVQTNDVSNVSLEQLESLRYCPMMFQERIEKKVELRVTIVGEKIFTCALDSQKNEKGQVDWRKAGVETIDDWYVYNDLPKDIEEKLLNYQSKQKLNYGAADIIVTPDGEYVFLEVNSAGEFNWLDNIWDKAISEEIANVLLDLSPRIKVM